MVYVSWLVLVNVLLLLSLFFSYCMGTRALFSFTFLFFSYFPREDCISGHCKLVFLLWWGHGGASTARLKFCFIAFFH